MSLATGRHSMHYDMMCGVTLALFRGEPDDPLRLHYERRSCIMGIAA